MDLSRGICILCTCNTKVLISSQVKNITNLLCGTILVNFIDVKKFEETSSTLKICTLCLHDILLVAEHEKKTDVFSESVHSCSLCHDEQNLVSITEWAHFDTLLKNICARRFKKCTVCLHCLKFLELLNRIKVNFLKKYPHLAISEHERNKKKYKNKPISPSKPHREHLMSGLVFSDSESDNESSNIQNTNNLKSALKHLKPLIFSSFNTDPWKEDTKLLKQVAFVHLGISNQPSRGPINQSLKRSNKLKYSSLSETDSSRDSSPKQSFFKIKLKLNANRTKAYKVPPGRVTKPQGKSNIFSQNKKELIVKIVQMDLKKLKQRAMDSEESFVKTPTKATRKVMPQDPLSSSKKRKSVTFAEDLNVEIVDGVNVRRGTMDGTPLKSLLKKGSSPTSDLLKNGSEGTSSDEDADLVGNIIKKINNYNDDSDDELDAANSYVEEIQKNNDNIFDSLMTSGNCIEKGDKKAETKMRTEVHVTSSESEDNDEDSSANAKLKKVSKKKRNYSTGNDNEKNDSDKEKEDRSSKINENDEDSDNALVESKKSNEEDNSYKEKTNPNKNKMVSDKSDDNEQSSSEAEDQSSQHVAEETTKDNDDLLGNKDVSPSKNNFSTFNSAASISSDSSKEDTLVTLLEYKKMRNSVEGSDDIDKNCSIEDNLKDSLDMFDEIEQKSDDVDNKEIDESSKRVSSVEKLESRKRRASFVDIQLAKKNKDDLEEFETNRDKVSDKEIDTNEIQSNSSRDKHFLQTPEIPENNEGHNVTTNEPLVDNVNTVSDSQNIGVSSEDTGPQLTESLVESQEADRTKISDKSANNQINTEDVSSSLGEQNKLDNNLNSAVHNSDNSTFEETDPGDISQKSSSESYVTQKSGSDSYSTVIGDDIESITDTLLDSPVK